MRKIIGWPMFWLCFGFGHAAFLVCDSKLWSDNITDGTWHDKLFQTFHDAYQAGMRGSLFWDRWANLKQWSEAS